MAAQGELTVRVEFAECPVCGVSTCDCPDDAYRAFREWHRANPGKVLTMTPYGFFEAGWTAARR
jgi:hypothetical protein